MKDYGKQLWVKMGDKNSLDKMNFTKVNNNGNLGIKGGGGLWTSTYIDESYGSAWVQWCLSNDFQIPEDKIWQGILLTPKKNLKLYHVDSLKDMHIMFDKYGYSYLPTLKQEAIDFEKMSQHYDGIHLTNHGEVVTRHGGLMFGSKDKTLKPEWKEKTMRNLYGWDSESTFHFKWNFEESFDEVTINGRYATEEHIEALIGNKFKDL